MTLSAPRSIYGINATATPIGPGSTGSIAVGTSNTTTTHSTADVAYVLRGIAVGSGDALALALTTGSTSGSTAFVAGNAQVETNTVVAASGATTGTMTLVVTAAGMTGSPKNIAVSLVAATHTTAALIAEAAVTALNADTAFAALFTATRSTAAIIITRKPTSTHTVPGGTLNLYAANDATLNLAIPSGLGVTAALTSTDTTAGVVSDGVKLYGQGADFEGEALSTIVTLYGVLFEVTTGAGVIAGSVDDVTPYSTGSVVQWLNANGLTNETALTITPSSNTDITITVLGKSS